MFIVLLLFFFFLLYSNTLIEAKVKGKARIYMHSGLSVFILKGSVAEVKF